MNRPGPHFCFSIPSAEMFEEKLVEAQKEIGISHNEYIPVTYQADSILYAEFNYLQDILIELKCIMHIQYCKILAMLSKRIKW